ncbi:hypothetical protein KSF_096380 [Reticulibacter mediterranei]|uniref:Uncharacterized protein n=1 Tax=Reticulibacter mediterranei TaxID=2778369 RepID=A0A8J3IW43_9CHLR|nr:hypothetical protein KSF_096380 [Reticulibacter mediterranei]
MTIVILGLEWKKSQGDFCDRIKKAGWAMILSRVLFWQIIYKEVYDATCDYFRRTWELFCF